jgi:hypothetical protein
MTKIVWPTCETCGVSDPFRCQVCKKFVCGDCYSLDDTGLCTHKRAVRIVDVGWEDLDNLLEQTMFELADRLYAHTNYLCSCGVCGGGGTDDDGKALDRARQYGWRPNRHEARESSTNSGVREEVSTIEHTVPGRDIANDD